MAVFTTSAGRQVSHCHVGPNHWPCLDKEWTMAEKQLKRELMAAEHPLAIEFRVPSATYNCHGYVYADSHRGVFGRPNFFLEDDYTEIPMAEAQPGDVLVYADDEEITHSAFVRQVTRGTIKKVRSKWGRMAAFTHKPNELPIEYGQPVQLFRRKV